MKSVKLLRPALLGTALLVGIPHAFADSADYILEPVTVAVKNGAGSELAVRLIHKPSGKPVSGAVLFRTRLDMSPDSMGEMTAKHMAMPASEPRAGSRCCQPEPVNASYFRIRLPETG